MRCGAVVLAGGRARRLGGVDKPALVVGGRTLLDTVLLACQQACVGEGGGLVVVGPRRRQTAVEVVWAREEPPHGGPVAALAAGLAALPDRTELVAVLAADLPGLGAATLRRLLDPLVTGDPDRADVDGVVLVDDGGRRQWLLGVWRVGVLRRELAGLGEASGRALHALLGGLRTIGVPARSGEAADVDTPADLAAHSRHTGRPVT